MRGANPQVLLVPRIRARRAADLATRRRLIANQRHSARRTRRVRRSLRAVGRVMALGLGLTAILIIALATTQWLQTTSLFAVDSVEVVGTRRLPVEIVRAAAGIEPGTNILTLDLEATEERVERLEGVRSASVIRELPKSVRIMVEEREPYALVNPTGADGLFWVDADGHSVGPERRPGVPPLPILSGVAWPALGTDVLRPESLRVGIAFLRAVQRIGGRVAGRISEIDLAAPDGPLLYMADGAEVRVGTDAWEERLARLDGVLGELETRGEQVHSVDLRFRDLVVLKPRQSAAASAEPRASGAGSRRRTTTISRAQLREHR